MKIVRSGTECRQLASASLPWPRARRRGQGGLGEHRIRDVFLESARGGRGCSAVSAAGTRRRRGGLGMHALARA